MKTNFFAFSGLLITSLFAAAQIPAVAQEKPMSSSGMPMGAPAMSTTTQSPMPTMGNVPRPEAALIDVQDQAVPDGKLFVKQVNAPNVGWLVVRESIAGKPGAVLGYVSLRTGMNQNVTVPLRALPSSGMAIVSVHSAPRTISTLNGFDLTSYPLAKSGNKSAISAISILPNNTMPMATPGS